MLIYTPHQLTFSKRNRWSKRRETEHHNVNKLNEARRAFGRKTMKKKGWKNRRDGMNTFQRKEVTFASFVWQNQKEVPLKDKGPS